MTARAWILVAVGVFALQAAVLLWLGQPAICECGYVKVWEGVVLSAGNSQHLTDWYSFSHVIHGFAFFFLLTWLFPRLSLFARLAIAVGLEAAWEILENTPMVIDHYREQALAQGYTGDSVLNSLIDTLMMVVGFLFAARFKWWAVIAFAAMFELFTIYMIRDGLIFNILGFIAPELLSGWQSQ
jgi:hypothetical protein